MILLFCSVVYLMLSFLFGVHLPLQISLIKSMMTLTRSILHKSAHTLKMKLLI